MVVGNKRTAIILVITMLWVLITLCGWTGNWFIGLISSVILMLLYMVLGASRKGVLSKKLLIYPILSWTTIWILGFILANHYANIFKGMMPDFTILGFHPSFAFIIFAYWVGGVLTLSLGFYLFSDHWLTDDDWTEFKNKIASINAAKEEV